MKTDPLPQTAVAFLIVAAILTIMANPLYADWTITQTVQLNTGWNAVFLTVEPTKKTLDAAFEGMPVDKVLTYYPQRSSVQFIQDPSEIPFNKAGWHFWVPKSHPENFMNNLFVLQANQPYLIHCAQDLQWKPSGTPVVKPMTWQPDSYNLTGFHIAPGSSPLFSAYFQGVKAFSNPSVYYLQNGNWIRGKSDMPLKSGQAYWIYCKGGTDYTAPLDVELPSPGDGLDFGQIGSEYDIVMTNRYAAPVTFTLAQTDSAVPISLVSYSVDTGKTYTPFTSYTSKSALAVGADEAVKLAIRRADLASNEVRSLLKLTDSIGGLRYIPVSAKR